MSSPGSSPRSWLVTHWTELAVGALIVAYLAFFGPLTVLQHNAFQTTAFDLGNVDQAVWNTRHGRPFAMTNIEGLTNRLGTHVEPILLPISLLYFLWSDPRTLLLLQTAILALGAWPVYLLARRALAGREGIPLRGSRRALPALFAAVYLLFPALESANVFDFHALALAPTFFLLAFYFLETEHWGWYTLFALLTMSCKEDMPLLVAMLGLYALFVRRQRLVGLATLAAAALWFLLAVGWVMPRFDTRGVSPLANRYAYLGDGPPEMLVTLLTQPRLVVEQLAAAGALPYLRDLLTPVAFFSLLAPQVLLLGLPSLAVNLLSSDGFMHQLEGFHYGVMLAPVVVVSAAYGMAWLLRRWPRVRWLPFLLGAAILIATLVYHYGHGYTPLAADFSGSWPQVTDHHRRGEELARSIPVEASLAALPHPNPHASQRQRLTMIDRLENGELAPLHGAEYVFVDVTNGWPLHPNDLKTGIESLLAGDYGLEQAADGWLLLRRGAAPKTLPDAFYDFARAAEPQPRYAQRVQFLLDGEPALESLGFDLDYQPRTESYSLTFYWRALRPLPPGLHLYPFYLDDATGEILEDTTQRPLIAALWYPPEQWRVGEVVQTPTLPWDVGPSFSIGLGVTQGDDWQEVEQRLPIRVESSDLALRLFDGDTWVRLLHVDDREPRPEYRQFAAPAPQVALDADFAGQIRLLGYDLDCERKLTACDLTLYWQAQHRLDSSYTVFVQALDAAGQVRAQVDSLPREGGYSTLWWLPGEVVADPYHLELPGEAVERLLVGLYDAATGERLPVTGTDSDYLELPLPH